MSRFVWLQADIQLIIPLNKEEMQILKTEKLNDLNV